MSQVTGVDTEKDNHTKKKGVRVCVCIVSYVCCWVHRKYENKHKLEKKNKWHHQSPVIIEGMKDSHPPSYEDKSWWHVQEALNYVQHGSTILPHEVSIHAM